MATVKKTKVTMHLSNGKTSVINMPEFINTTLTDPDSGDSLYPKCLAPFKAAFESDDGAGVDSFSIALITTDTVELVNKYNG